MGRLLDIARVALPEPDVGDQLPTSDPYAERMRVALRQINRPDYRSGMVPWLDRAHPDLYAEVVLRLPDEASRLWNERAPLEQFDAVLTRWVSLHQRCCELYREPKDNS